MSEKAPWYQVGTKVRMRARCVDPAGQIVEPDEILTVGGIAITPEGNRYSLWKNGKVIFPHVPASMVEAVDGD